MYFEQQQRAWHGMAVAVDITITLHASGTAVAEITGKRSAT